MVALNGFATLIPAFSMLIPFETKVYPEGNNYRMGPNNAGAYFEYSPSYVTDSYIISEPGYSNISVNATVQFGADKVTLQGNPTSGINAAKLDFQGVAVTDDLAQIYFDFTGTVRSGPQTSQLFSGNPNFNGSDFGYGFIQLGFQTGDQKYKFMEDKQYVASQRYIKSPSSSVLSLEFRISEVV